MKKYILSLIFVFTVPIINAQFKYQPTTKKSYSATNLKKSKTTNYSRSIKKTSKSVPISYSPEIYNKNLPNEANKKIIQLLPKGIQSFSFAKNGGWVIITKNNEFYNYNAPKDCVAKIEAFKRIGHTIKQVSFHQKRQNSWVIVTDKTTYSRNIPNDCYAKIQALQKSGKKIKSVSFDYKTNESWVIVNTDGSFYANNIDDRCYLVLKNIEKSKNDKLKLSNVVFSTSGNWLVLTNSYSFNGTPTREMHSFVANVERKNYNINLVTYTPNAKSWSVIANSKYVKPSSISISDINISSKRNSPALKKNSYTSGDGTRDIRKWVLKVTLDYFYCDKSDDSDNKDDYILNQWVVYTDKNNNNIEKIGGKMKVNNSRQISTKKQTLDYRHIVGNNIIIKGDEKHQFWVEEGKRKKIGNYILFEITEELLNDKNSRFIIYSSLVERSDKSGGLLTIGSFPGAGIDMSGPGEVLFDIKKVITDLAYLDKVKSGEWRNYGDINIKMRKYNSQSDDLYGYIPYWNDDLDRKAKAMMRFELIQ